MAPECWPQFPFRSSHTELKMLALRRASSLARTFNGKCARAGGVSVALAANVLSWGVWHGMRIRERLF